MPSENRIAIAVGVACLIAGIVSLVVLHGVAQVVAASMLLGFAGVAGVSLAFLIVGQGEEEDRRRHPHG
jgi:hypothetical protein